MWRVWETPDGLATHLFAPGELGVAARDAMRANMHMVSEQRDYFAGVGRLLERPPLFIFRQDVMAEDLALFEQMLGLPEERLQWFRQDRINVTLVESALSPEGENNLRRWFWPEILFYEELRDMAEWLNQA